MKTNIQKAMPTSKDTEFSQEHITGIDHLSPSEIAQILELADSYAKKINSKEDIQETLSKKIIFNLFFEASTRTRMSFEVAAKRLGAKVINFNTDGSSLKKGESFSDTIATLNAMAPDGVIIRHSEFGAPEYLAKNMGCPVISGGDSWREHPTQALLDALTIKQEKGKLEGLNIAICGDIAHSRVASSNMILLSKMNANVRIIAPPALMPEKPPSEDIQKFESIDDGLKDCDIAMTLRIQKERMQAGLLKSEIEYHKEYGLTHDRLKHAKQDCLVMHPGPMNRGIEISDELADDPERSLINKQVTNGVAVRMAVLDLLISKR